MDAVAATLFIGAGLTSVAMIASAWRKYGPAWRALMAQRAQRKVAVIWRTLERKTDD